MVRTVEFGRGLAALAVAMFHANASARHFGGPTWNWARFGDRGVDFFFVLSGFIIVVAHRADLGRPGAAWRYLLKRAIRLLPALWLVVLAWALVRATAGVPPDAMTVLRSLLPWPSLAPTLPIVVWTLRHEVIFYLLVLLAIAAPRTGAAVCGLWVAAAVVQIGAAIGGRPATGIASLVLSSYTLDFAMGAGVAQAFARGQIRPGRAPLAVAVAALGIVLWAEAHWQIVRPGPGPSLPPDYLSIAAACWTPVLGLVFAGVLWGLVAIEPLVRVPRWAVLLGAASYAVYLVHTPVNALAQRLAAHLPAASLAVGAGHLLLVGSGVATGVALHLMFERPVTRWLRAMLPAAAAQEAQADGALASIGTPRQGGRDRTWSGSR